MAVRRMFHADVIGSDSFLELPFSAQMLYIQISMACDDDGFFNGARRMARLIGSGEEDLELLEKKRFLLHFDGVVVVKHWRMANSLKSDRIKPLSYPEIAEKIYLKPNRAYTDHPGTGYENLLELRNSNVPTRNPDGIPEEEKREEEKRNEMKRTEVRRKEDQGIQDFVDNPVENLIPMTFDQKMELMGEMGQEKFGHYLQKLENFRTLKQVKIRDPYNTILRWWKEDKLRSCSF